MKVSVAHPNPGKRSAENFTKISRQISRHFWQRKTEKCFTSALLQGSCSEVCRAINKQRCTRHHMRTHPAMLHITATPQPRIGLACSKRKGMHMLNRVPSVETCSLDRYFRKPLRGPPTHTPNPPATKKETSRTRKSSRIHQKYTLSPQK